MTSFVGDSARKNIDQPNSPFMSRKQLQPNDKKYYDEDDNWSLASSLLHHGLLNLESQCQWLHYLYAWTVQRGVRRCSYWALKEVYAYQHLGEVDIPKFTLIVAQKNHHTQLFQAFAPKNVPLGTVVDTKIVHTRNYDFYMCSHAGLMDFKNGNVDTAFIPKHEEELAAPLQTQPLATSQKERVNASTA